jgi:plasmid stabilization system protein ParE
VKVVWTDTAIAHLADIYEYIARDSARYALRMVDRITGRTKQLSNSPQSGEAVPEYGRSEIRELIEGPYRIIYRIQSDVIEVLAVTHGARLLPENPPESATE